MLHLLERIDCQVFYNTAQTCCGMAAFYGGHWDEAKEVGEKFITEFSGKRKAIGIGGSCTGMVRNTFSELFHNSVVHNQCKSLQGNLMEFTEFMADPDKLRRLPMRLNAKVVYMDACQALRECSIKSEPRMILDHIQELQWQELPKQETCCGFGGVFSVRDEAESVALGKAKIEAAIAQGADYIVSTDPACLLHLQSIIDKNYSGIAVLHIADLMHKSLIRT